VTLTTVIEDAWKVSHVHLILLNSNMSSCTFHSCISADPLRGRSGLVQFHQHAATRDSPRIPTALVVNGNWWPWTFVIPPSRWRLTISWMSIFILIQTGKLHSVGSGILDLMYEFQRRHLRCTQTRWNGTCISPVICICSLGYVDSFVHISSEDSSVFTRLQLVISTPEPLTRCFYNEAWLR